MMNSCAELLLVHPGGGLWLKCRETRGPDVPRIEDSLGGGTFSTCLGLSWSPNHNNSSTVVSNLPFRLQFNL